MNFEQIIFITYLAFIFLLSLIAFALYGKDKKMAVNGGGKVRVKEKALLGVTALGGALGAFIGRKVFHHKTDKKYFSLTIYFSILVEFMVVGLLVYVAFLRNGVK